MRDLKDRLEGLSVRNERGFSGQAGAFDFSAYGFGLDLGYGLDTAQSLLVAIENGLGGFERRCLRPNLLRPGQSNASKQDNSELHSTHVR